MGSEDAGVKPGSAGKSYFHTQVRVVTESGQDAPSGELGEVIVKGRHVMKGYWNRPDATSEAIRDGWLYTGDAATMDEDGYVYIRDRKKDMIISGGENIYPAEIEQVLQHLPQVKEVAVIGQPSVKWGESPIAIVVLKDGAALSAEDVIGYCRGRVAKFKLPRGVEFVRELPRNPIGKVQKHILRQQFPGPAPA
jgi:acyl-CoA synthetase (AMP-forming)/AMP-acid ligase II